MWRYEADIVTSELNIATLKIPALGAASTEKQGFFCYNLILISQVQQHHYKLFGWAPTQNRPRAWKCLTHALHTVSEIIGLLETHANQREGGVRSAAKSFEITTCRRIKVETGCGNRNRRKRHI